MHPFAVVGFASMVITGVESFIRLKERIRRNQEVARACTDAEEIKVEDDSVVICFITLDSGEELEITREMVFVVSWGNPEDADTQVYSDWDDADTQMAQLRADKEGFIHLEILQPLGTHTAV